MSKRNALILLIIIGIVGIVLRSYQLTARSLWFDEAFSWRLIQFPFQEMIARDAADVHPPLYYIVLQAWSIVFGTSLLSLRAMSVLFAGTTILASYGFTVSATRSRRAGLLSAALIALSGWQIAFAWEARMYTLGTTLALLSSWALLKAIRDRKTVSWVMYGVVTAAFAYIHYYALFTIGAQIMFICGYVFFKSRFRFGEIMQSKTLWLAALSGVVMALLYSPWVPTFLKQNSQVQESYWIPTIGGWSIPDTFFRFYLPTSGIPCHETIPCSILTSIPITVTLLLWAWLFLKPSHLTERFTLPLVAILGLGPFLMSIAASFAGQSLYQDRFFVFANIFILIGFAIYILHFQKRPIRIALGVSAILFIGFTSVQYWQELDIGNKPGARAATKYIVENRQPGEQIVVTSPFVYFAVDHYIQEDFDNRISRKLYSENGQLNHFSGGPILSQSDIVGPEAFNAPSVDNAATGIWVVDTTGFGGSIFEVPDTWQLVERQSYPEVFSHQGEVFISRYQSQLDSTRD